IILSFPHDLVRFTTIVSLLFISFFFYFYCDLRFLHSFPTRRSSYLREYLPAAREAIAVSANPNGSACYDASVRYHSSLPIPAARSEEHTSELQAHLNLVCRLLLENKNLLITSDNNYVPFGYRMQAHS